jgi:hypothetical protein
MASSLRFEVAIDGGTVLLSPPLSDAPDEELNRSRAFASLALEDSFAASLAAFDDSLLAPNFKEADAAEEPPDSTGLLAGIFPLLATIPVEVEDEMVRVRRKYDQRKMPGIWLGWRTEAAKRHGQHGKLTTASAS